LRVADQAVQRQPGGVADAPVANLSLSRCSSLSIDRNVNKSRSTRAQR
jgi:hypothetical protein